MIFRLSKDVSSVILQENIFFFNIFLSFDFTWCRRTSGIFLAIQAVNKIAEIKLQVDKWASTTQTHPIYITKKLWDFFLKTG